MTDTLILQNYSTAKQVDLTKANASISRQMVNPLAIISIPTDKTLKASRQYFVDLTMVQDTITIDFILRDGIGTHDGAGGTTNYEKILDMFTAGGTKWLVWGGKTFIVAVQSFNAINEPGQKDILRCNIKLAVGTKAIPPT
jgi:hypothetical protein